MEKRLFTSVSLLALLCCVSCGAFKPEHPQIYKSFKDRRAPSENQMASSGEFGKQEARQEVRFRPYSGVGEPMQVAQNEQNTNPASSFPQKAGTNGPAYEKQAGSAVSSTGASSESFIDRLLRALNLKGATDQKVAYNDKRVPVNNIEAAAYSNQHVTAQGSTNAYSYFEIADEIPAHQTSEFGNVKVAAPGSFEIAADNSVNLPSPPALAEPATPAPVVVPAPVEAPKAPSVPPVVQPPQVPNEPALNDMKQKIPEQPVPDLKNVPKAPHEPEVKPAEMRETAVQPAPVDNAKVAPKQVKANKAKMKKTKKVVSKTKKLKSKKVVVKQVKPVPAGIPSEDAIRDTGSVLEYIEGKPVVTGYLGE